MGDGTCIQKDGEMSKHNRTFELTVSDIDLIEAALHITKRDLSADVYNGTQEMLPADETVGSLRKIDDLLGRLHNQKIFYRPSKGTYLGG
ncbi:MAG: hypothetical protein ACI80I_001877 [Akkermansiaceae bacterium]|jgi:hypothetical protein